MNNVPAASNDTSFLHKPDDKHTASFLLNEYERLSKVRSEIAQRASKRFEFYLTIVTATLGAYILISQAQSGISIPRYILDLCGLGLFGFGIITYLNLTFASVFNLECYRAVRAIQNYFIIHDPTIEQHMYFNTPDESSKRYGLRAVVTRGVGGGSEKTLLACVNSALATYLVLSLLCNYLNIQLLNIELVVIGFVVFLISCFLHAIILTLMYRSI